MMALRRSASPEAGNARSERPTGGCTGRKRIEIPQVQDEAGQRWRVRRAPVALEHGGVAPITGAASHSVRDNGQPFLRQALYHEIIGVEEVQDAVSNVIDYETLLARFDERTRTITGAPSVQKDD